MSSTKSFAFAGIACLFAIFTYISCKKTEQLLPTSNQVFTMQRFFRGSQSISEDISAISSSIRRQNNEAHFLETLVHLVGYPLWNKTKEVGEHQNPTIQDGRSVRIAGSLFYYIPFCKDTSTFIGAVLIVKITGSDTTFRMLYHWQYQTLPFTKTSDTAWTASDVFHLFTGFQRDIFGQTKFIIRDGRLLRPGYSSHRGVIATIRPHGSADTLSLNIAGEDCDGYDYCYNPAGDGECPGGGCKKDCQYWIYEEWNCTDYTILPGTGGSDGAPSGNTGNGTGGSNGGGNWYDSPCRSIAAAGASPCDGNGGGSTPGWQPVINDEPFDPYSAAAVIVDTSITKHYPCVQKIIDSLASYVNLNAIAQVALHNVFGVNKRMHLTIIADSLLNKKDTIDGTTRGDNSLTALDDERAIEFYATIRLNPWVLKHSTQEYIAATIIHEAVHAYIDFKWSQYRLGIIDSTTFKNLFPIFWSPKRVGAYFMPPSNLIQHNAMAGSLVDIMAAPLGMFNANIPPAIRDSFFRALSWGGLEETTSWAARSDTNTLTAFNLIARDTAIRAPFHFNAQPNVNYYQDHTTLNLKTSCN